MEVNCISGRAVKPLYRAGNKLTINFRLQYKGTVSHTCATKPVILVCIDIARYLRYGTYEPASVGDNQPARCKREDFCHIVAPHLAKEEEEKEEEENPLKQAQA